MKNNSWTDKNLAVLERLVMHDYKYNSLKVKVFSAKKLSTGSSLLIFYKSNSKIIKDFRSDRQWRKMIIFALKKHLSFMNKIAVVKVLSLSDSNQNISILFSLHLSRRKDRIRVKFSKTSFFGPVYPKKDFLKISLCVGVGISPYILCHCRRQCVSLRCTAAT